MLIGAICYAEGAATSAKFRAAVTISNMPGMSGIVKGAFSYDFASNKYSIQYSSPSISGFRDIYDYTASDTGRVHYSICSSRCDAETLVEEKRRFHTLIGDTKQSGTFQINSQTCDKYVPVASPKGDVAAIYIATGGSAASALPVSVVLTNGQQFDFSAYGDVLSTDYTFPSTCPKRTCLSLLDVVFLLDESGSVDSFEFEQLRSFTYQVTNGFNINPTGTKVGIRKFGATTSPTTVTPLSDCKSCVLTTIQQMVSGFYSATCIACGMEALMNEFRINGRTNSVTGKPVDRVSIVITDGDANERTADTQTTCNNAKSLSQLSNGGGQTIFVVGVGDDISDATLNVIASSKPGLTTKFRATDYSQLNTVIDAITVSTCLDLTASKCGTACKGFCGCATCYCPECVQTANVFCSTQQCTVGQNGNGCGKVNVVCDDHNACTVNNCVDGVSGGCNYATPTPCTGTDKCYTYGCTPSSGCNVPSKINCDDGDPCTTDGCNPASGCTHTPVGAGLNCSGRCASTTCTPITCQINECDPSTNPGLCKARARDCNDQNGCTVNDRCEADVCKSDLKVCDDSNPCTDDSCSAPAGDCLFTAFNATVRCDDKNICTNDLCDAGKGGCYHENITCPAFDVCHVGACSDEEGGCYSTFLVCDEVPEIKALLKGGCYVSSCSTSTEASKQGCYLTKMENATVDDCGKCAGDGTACQFSNAASSSAALGGLAVAAIVVVVIAVAAAIAIFAGQKGYEVWARGHQSLSGAHHNPGYDAGNLTGKNPLYDAGGAEMK